ncbi:MAG: PQQ-binding-like beta-propeller repeat protein [Thermoplasmatales archaeon]|nr:PQQ-binding-like beta-propeller repeat protein [Thermoplasmatales archaeon]
MANQYPGSKHVDLTIGSYDGTIYYYENTGYYAYESNWSSKNIYNDVNTYLQVLDHPARYSKPALADLDDDGDFDLTIGTDSGKLYYFRNDGTSTNPSWTYVSGMYDNMETRAYAAPVLADMDKNKLMTDNCLYDIVVGRGDGHIHLYKNVGTNSNAGWDVFPYAAENVSHHLKYRNLSYLEEYVNLILDVENEYVDEIAFCIAHTSVDVLTDDDVYPDVFRKNAELIYEINNTGGIQYANLVEKGDISTGDYWTTIEYHTNEGLLELPPDIYYWFVVHPKITDEIPTFINPENGRPDENGVFWREYLFYHADENYPPDPDTDTNNDGVPDYYYPKDEKPPLLKDKIANITIMYDNVPYTAPAGYDNYGHYFEGNPRNWNWSYDKGHAVEVVSNWVEKTLPLNEQESDDGEHRGLVQPVRIAHHHNGNCGELQDLTVAAARTCMIPAAGVSLIGEDHVWSEFYSGNSWHQWDNLWSDSGSVIDQFNYYWTEFCGGHRGGSGIFKWNGDDSITDVSDKYLIDKDGNHVSSVTKVVVNDANGNPVDGAKVVVSSYWYADNYIESITGMTFRFVHYVPGAAYPSIWGYTDSDGTCEFRLVGNFTINISSKMGSDEKNVHILKEGETATVGDVLCFMAGVDYGWITNDATEQTKWEMNYGSGNTGGHAGGDIRNRYNDYTGDYGEWFEPGNYTVHYVTDRTHAYNDWVAEPPTNPEKWGIGVTGGGIDISLTKAESKGYKGYSKGYYEEKFTLIQRAKLDIYCVGEWVNSIKFKLSGTIPNPGLKKDTEIPQSPLNYMINISYEVTKGIQSQENLYVDNEYLGEVNTYIDFFITDKTNMKKYLNGLPFDYRMLNINYASNASSDYIDNDWYIVFSNDDAETKKIMDINITLKREKKWNTETTMEVHPNGFISGTASSDVNITKIRIRVNDGSWITAWSGISSEPVSWNYTLNMSIYYPGKCIIYARVVDEKRYVNIVSQEGIIYCPLPAINIVHPISGEMIEKTISVSGTASDINIIQKMWVKIGDGKWADLEITEEEGGWNWRNKTGKGLDTTAVNDGGQKIYVKAFNGIMYTVVSVEVIVDNNPPDVNILSLSENEVVSGNTIVSGNASDVNGVREIKIGIDENRKSSYWYEKDWEQKGIIEAYLSSDGEYIAAITCTPCDDHYWHNLSLFQKDSSTPLWTFEDGPSSDKQIPISISSDGSYIVVAGGNGVLLFKKDSNVPLWAYTAHQHAIDRILISSDGKYIVAGDRAGIIYLFETDSSTPLWIYETEEVVKSVSISADGNYIVVGTAGSGGGGNGTLYLFDRGNSTPLWSYNIGTWIESTSMSIDGKYIVAGTYDHKVYLFQNNSNLPLWNYTTGGLVGSVSMSSDGKYIVAGGWDGNISFFEKSSGTPLWICETGGLINCVDISSDGGRIVASGYNIHTGINTTYVFDNESNSPTWSYRFEGVPYLSLLSDDAKYIAVVSHAGDIYSLHFFQEKSLPTGVNVSWAYPLDTTELSEGKHTIYASAFDGLHYQNISVNITVDNNKPPEILYSPANDNIAIKENSTQTFKVVNNVDPEGGDVIIQWFLNGKLVGTEPSYTFTAGYTGEYSSDNSPFYVKVAVSDKYWYDGKTGNEYTNRTWVLTVENVNRAPVISNFTPTDTAITMNEGESKTFSIINASDPDGTAPAVTWYRYLTGESKGDQKGSGASYTFYSDYNSAGTYIVEAVVSDGEKSISRVWVLTVKDVNRAFTFDGFSPNQTVIEMKKGSGKTFSVINADDPENNLIIEWYVNGEFVDNKESYTFIPASYGTYVVSVTLSDGEKTETYSWTIKVKSPQAPGFEVLSFLMVLGILIILRKIKRKS